MLTERSSFLSRLLKASSACGILVPPAPSALSNSVLLILPSPSASICENRSFREADWLAKADVFEPIDVWLCAASSAPMVAGDICEAPPGTDGGVEFPEAWPFPGTSHGLAGACLKPVTT